MSEDPNNSDRTKREIWNAIILCGGESKRMGHDKAWLACNGQYFLTSLCRSLSPLVTKLVVVKAAGQQLPPLPELSNLSIAHDEFPTQGPLCGFVTGLKLLQDESSQGPVWLASCDSPFFSETAFRFLRSRLAARNAVAVEDSEHLHPFSAWYGLAAQRTAMNAFAGGARSLTRVLRDCDCAAIPVDDVWKLDEGLKFLRSVNTPEDLEWAAQNWR